MTPNAPSFAPGDLLTIPEATEILRCSTSTLRRYVQNGTLPALRLGREVNGHLRFRRADVDAMLIPAIPTHRASAGQGPTR